MHSPEIQLLCYTCQPLDSRPCSQSLPYMHQQRWDLAWIRTGKKHTMQKKIRTAKFIAHCDNHCFQNGHCCFGILAFACSICIDLCGVKKCASQGFMEMCCQMSLSRSKSCANCTSSIRVPRSQLGLLF